MRSLATYLAPASAITLLSTALAHPAVLLKPMNALPWHEREGRAGARAGPARRRGRAGRGAAGAPVSARASAFCLIAMALLVAAAAPAHAYGPLYVCAPGRGCCRWMST
jgi:hypothetical protein